MGQFSVEICTQVGQFSMKLNIAGSLGGHCASSTIRLLGSGADRALERLVSPTLAACQSPP